MGQPVPTSYPAFAAKQFRFRIADDLQSIWEYIIGDPKSVLNIPIITLPKTNIAPENRSSQKEN